MSTNTPNPSNPAGSSNEPTGASGSTPSSQPNSELEAAVDRVLERKVTPMLEDDRLNRKTDRLRGQVGWLTGITIASVLILGGALAWSVNRLQTQQERLANSVASGEEAGGQVQQLREQLQTNQERLQAMRERLQEIGSGVNSNESALNRIADSLRGIAERGSSGSESPSAEPSPSQTEGSQEGSQTDGGSQQADGTNGGGNSAQ
jgi:chromosome segregation ATPase